MRFSVVLPITLLAGSQIGLALPTPATSDSVGIVERADDSVVALHKLNARESDGHADVTNRLEERNPGSEDGNGGFKEQKKGIMERLGLGSGNAAKYQQERYRNIETQPLLQETRETNKAIAKAQGQQQQAATQGSQSNR